MKTALNLRHIIFYLLLFICNTNTQWVQQNSGLGTGQHLLDVSFINKNTGWACGYSGIIIKTTNAGTNWILQNSSVTNKNLYGIHAVDSQFVYAVGYFQTILKSTNGGTNWLIIRNGTWGNDPSFFGLYFLNRNTGWLLRNEYVLRTTNGGLSFDSTHVNNWPRDVYFKDALTGVICAEAAEIFKSTDGGLNWALILIPQTTTESPDFFKESFIGNTGWVIGRATNVQGLGPLVWKTTNFGSSWDTIGRVPYPYTLENYCVYFSSLNTGFCGGTNGWMFKTTSSGVNWIQQNTPGGFKQSIWFFNDSIGWVVGASGLVLYTTTGGQYVEVKKISNKIPATFRIYQNFPNPFNIQTTIQFDILEKDYYKMEIYNLLGQKIDEVFNEVKLPGKYEFSYNANNISSGVYIYTLSTAKSNLSKYFTLIK